MRRDEFIYVALIKMDRYPMNLSTLRLIDYLRKGGKVPAIKVAKLQNGKYIIRDGRHRVLAYKMLEIPKIRARFSDVPMIDHSSRTT